MANKKYDIDELKLIRSSWNIIPIDAIPEEDRDSFSKRKLAIDMYIDNQKTEDIEKETGFCRTNIIRYLDKCLKIDSNGDYYGS